MIENKRTDTWQDSAAESLFWVWNVIFLAFMGLGFAPLVLPELIREVIAGMLQLNFLLYALIVSLIPLLVTLVGLFKLRNDPQRLFALGYVVEGPLMLLLLVRLFVIRQMSPGFLLLFVVALLGMAVFAWQIFDRQLLRRQGWLNYLRLAGLSLMLLTSLYAALWMAFYAVPLLGMMINWIVDTVTSLPSFLKDVGRTFQDLLLTGILWVPFYLMGMTLGLFTMTLFAVGPLVIPWLCARAWWRSLLALKDRAGWALPSVLVAVIFAATGALFWWSNRQPQGRIFALLEEPPATQAEAQELLKQRESIRAGLLNAYLAPFRYFSAEGEVRHIRMMYQDTFDLPAPRAFGVQRIYESVARPLLYTPIHRPTSVVSRDNQAFQSEPQEAARLYQRFFDTPIVEAEREAIVSAVRASWNANQVEAAWQAVDDREVYLVEQQLNVQENEGWAEIELMEVYQNQTAREQEVLYYFSLPESAVITGLWLGDSPDKERAFAYQVAPRGAAQAVYRNEVRRNVDPALVEQIGPRQYRLRAFPMPPLRLNWNPDNGRSRIEEAPYFYLWLTYRTLPVDGAWPLPRLALGRNVYRDRATVRQANGAAMDVALDEWLPEALPMSVELSPGVQRVDFPNQMSVLAIPAEQAELPGLAPDLPLAVVLDRSYSMHTQAEQVADTLNQLRTLLPDGMVDLYLSASPYRGEAPELVRLDGFAADEVVYFGGQNAAELLAQFNELRGEREYTAVLVLTDGSGYELGASDIDPGMISLPVWLVHLGGELSLGYDDRTLEVIQASGGGVAGSLSEALQRMALGRAQAEPGTRRDLVDGYVWEVLPAEQADALGLEAQLHTDGDGFQALAARQLILAEMRARRGDLSDLATLDGLHALAMEHGIVTPYSSMIVLVNREQQNLLERLSELDDRYAREFEELGETTPATNTPLTGVPEPHEWLLIGLALALLLWYAYRKRPELLRIPWR